MYFFQAIVCCLHGIPQKKWIKNSEELVASKMVLEHGKKYEAKCIEVINNIPQVEIRDVEGKCYNFLY